MWQTHAVLFYHEAKQLSVVVHGDDFTALGARAELEWYEAGLRDAFEIKSEGTSRGG